MLSAVENFGPASAATNHHHPYAQHNPFALAAAAAAGSAAACAAAVMPTHHHQTHNGLHSALEHYTIDHSQLFANGHGRNPNPNFTGITTSGIFLPPAPPTSSATTSSLPISILSMKTSPQEYANHSPRHDRKSVDLDNSCAMSSAEFARPHPKQPRYNSNSVNSNNNNNSLNHNNNNNNSVNSNGIPLHLRAPKSGANAICMNNNNNNVNNNNHLPSPRPKYSTEQQSGPVNLVTSNNSNNSANLTHSPNSNRSSTSPPSQQQHGDNVSHSPMAMCNGGVQLNKKLASPSSTETDLMAGIYAQKLPYTTSNVVTNAAAAVAAASYQFNYPHIYASRALYGTPALYSGHHRLSQHGRSTFLGPPHTPQHEPQSAPFSPYLPQAVAFATPPVPVQSQGGILRPSPSAAQGLAHSAASLLNNNNSQQHQAVDNRQPQLMHNLAQVHPSATHNLAHDDRPNDIKHFNGTYLNGKVNNSPAAPESVSGFKVPSGKEGSLKHRILIRPSERDASGKSQGSAPVVRSPSTSTAPSNFTKGSFIELANGVLRRVEDMRTEDFIQSAEKSPIHQLADSTVVKINATPHSVVITFSYHKNRSKADVEVSQEHPFFVYGQGWASCNPELSMQSFGLKCQRLQVGDVCISLMLRDTATATQSLPSPPNRSHPNQSVPQNLSRKSQQQQQQPVNSTIPTTATGTAVSSRMSTGCYIPHQYLPPPLPPTSSHMSFADMAGQYEVNAAAMAAQISRHQASSNGLMSPLLPPSIHSQSNAHNRLKFMHSGNSRNPTEYHQMSPPPQSLSAPVSRPPSNQPFYLGISAGENANRDMPDGQMDGGEQPVDASLSRKRRWSAPDNICDDDNESSQGTPRKVEST